MSHVQERDRFCYGCAAEFLVNGDGAVLDIPEGIYPCKQCKKESGVIQRYCARHFMFKTNIPNTFVEGSAEMACLEHSKYCASHKDNIVSFTFKCSFFEIMHLFRITTFIDLYSR
jgi:hypothetical protein